MSHARRTVAALLALGALAALAGCGGSSDSAGATAAASGGSGPTLSLVAYSTPEVVYDQIVPDFQKTAAGRGVSFKTSYGASGDQSRAVDAGLRADVVTFSTEPDMTRLVRDGIVAADGNAGPNRGLVTTSVVAFVVRKGNPKHIRTWADLLRPGVKVLTPNPYSSGAAKWNLLAAYGQASGAGKDSAAGLAYVRALISHVPVQDKSGRDALNDFTSGNGDVLLSYEYEATTAQKKGQSVDYVLPDRTIKIDIDIATTKTAPPAARAFLAYVLSQPAQQRFADWGYRPVNAAVLAANKGRFPTPSGLFTIDQLGGWRAVDDKLFDVTRGAITKIEQGAGVSTAK